MVKDKDVCIYCLVLFLHSSDRVFIESKCLNLDIVFLVESMQNK